MALRQNTAEGGINGSAVAAGTSGGSSGDAFNIVGRDSNSTITWDNSIVADGNLSYKFIAAANEHTTVTWNGYASIQLSALWGFYYTAAPTANTFMGLLFGINNVAALYINTAGKLFVQNAVGATIWTAASAMPQNTWLYIRVYTVLGTTASNGTIKVDYWQKGGNAAIDSYISTTANTVGAGPNTSIANIQFGKVGAGASAFTFWLDDLAADDTASDFLSIPSGNTPPTANAGSDQANIEPYTVVTLNGTDSDSDGTVASRAWTQVSGSPSVSLSGASTALAMYTAPGTIAGTNLTFGYQVTDNSGASSTQDTVQHTILPVTERAVMGGAEVPVHTSVAQSGSLQ